MTLAVLSVDADEDLDIVSCVIALPAQLFRGTQIPVCVWFFAKDKKAEAELAEAETKVNELQFQISNVVEGSSAGNLLHAPSARPA